MSDLIWMVIIFAAAVVVIADGATYRQRTTPEPSSPVSVRGGEWSKNPPKNDCKLAVGWTVEPGTMHVGDIICVRATVQDTPKTAVVTIGGIDATLYTAPAGGGS